MDNCFISGSAPPHLDTVKQAFKMAGFRLYKGPGLLAHAYSVKHRVFTDISTSTTTKPFVVRVVRVLVTVSALSSLASSLVKRWLKVLTAIFFFHR